MLKPVDLAVLLYLMLRPNDSYGRMSAMLGVSKSTAHAATARLIRSGLVHPVGGVSSAVAFGPALEFLQFGAAYAFAPELSPKARGVPTGLSAAGIDQSDLLDETPTVWPSQLGNIVGRGLKPLVPSAPDLALRDPQLYKLFALVDALRLADARTRGPVRDILRDRIKSIPRG